MPPLVTGANGNDSPISSPNAALAVRGAPEVTKEVSPLPVPDRQQQRAPRPEPIRFDCPPILADKSFAAPSIFSPANLLREARRQKALHQGETPAICVLDPDGDIVRALQHEARASRSATWACYHTELYEFESDGEPIGIIGCGVGASFAVLLAEQLFASGCQFLISVSSAGQVLPLGAPPYFVVIDRALRDEGTSYHYLPPAAYAEADPVLVDAVIAALRRDGLSAYRGAAWTTDAPFRETAEAIAACRARGILAADMEAAALYAFARARKKPVLCLAQVTNRMALIRGDFEKGEANGAYAALEIIAAVARTWRGETGPRR